jgi:hypothetical protein
MLDPLKDLELPSAVLAQALPLSVIGLKEVAWPRSAALEILRLLRGKAVAVLSGDVVRLDSDRPRHAHENWHAEPAHAEPFVAYAQRSIEEAEAYITGDPEPSHYYILVLADRLP